MLQVATVFWLPPVHVAAILCKPIAFHNRYMSVKDEAAHATPHPAHEHRENPEDHRNDLLASPRSRSGWEPRADFHRFGITCPKEEGRQNSVYDDGTCD